MRLLGIAIALAGCSFPTPSETFRCSEGCDNGRVCDEASGFCVVSDVDAAVVNPPADAPADQMVDADPFIAIAQMCKDAGYLEEAAAGNGLFKRHLNQGEATSWVNAENDCKDDVPGATHLIVLSTMDEVTFLRGATNVDAWVGLNDIAVEAGGNGANFVTITGETGDQRPFAGGEPNNGDGNEDCVAMRGSDNNLDDKPCNNFAARYVCECDGKPANP